ncbi:MAG: serine/threonine protein kinase [Clostridia bacterium]|nr:serine/threonine protein kinase [Clostridia bacterium]
MDNEATVCGENYRVIRLLGHGKGGYSYLADKDGRLVVLKQIHHEPCDYYSFGNKIEAERRDYGRLQQAGIRIPELIAIDEENERVVKEYVEGNTVFDLVKNGESAEPYLGQVREMAAKAREAGLNIDYFPTNFVIRDGLIWYVDYECNEYMEEWNFENWGIKYWSRTPEFEEYVKQHERTE